MKLSLESLQEMGAFAPVDLTEETVTWRQDGEDVSATVFVKPLSYKTAVSEIVASRENTDALAARIAASICDEAGEPVFSVGDITGEADPERGPLNHNLTMALLEVIGRVSGLGKSKSRSVTKKKSGTSS
ncbi:phage tail assembly chaperone family protein, TAC [uncultured Halomonas sp.]|uniref:phage tail assembly chaperone family protein, TAC n=1 Tax=uncultured Halomonas sp. TaxID=173971 RepID=UPI00259A4677|nr:phage tail assembly chaperone family protein, TAC [uncultured Halomonas sp.]|tara:strand:+ start:479 stop:868 length:390 start_codon:yes stop_codon:yes gene_type:complete